MSCRKSEWISYNRIPTEPEQTEQGRGDARFHRRHLIAANTTRKPRNRRARRLLVGTFDLAALKPNTRKQNVPVQGRQAACCQAPWCRSVRRIRDVSCRLARMFLSIDAHVFSSNFRIRLARQRVNSRRLVRMNVPRLGSADSLSLFHRGLTDDRT